MGAGSIEPEKIFQALSLLAGEYWTMKVGGGGTTAKSSFDLHQLRSASESRLLGWLLGNVSLKMSTMFCGKESVTHWTFTFQDQIVGMSGGV